MTDQTDEQRARELSVSWNYKPEAICDALLDEVPQDEIDFFVELIQSIRAEQSAELEKAMVVVRHCLDSIVCPCCGSCVRDGRMKEFRPHNAGCPLVAGGFTGERR
jgi:hypothetical protein